MPYFYVYSFCFCFTNIRYDQLVSMIYFQIIIFYKRYHIFNTIICNETDCLFSILYNLIR